VHLITEEQSSGSCWNEDDMEEPCQYEIKMSLVRNSIRYLLSVILPKTNKKNLNSIADDILVNNLALKDEAFCFLGSLKIL